MTNVDHYDSFEPPAPAWSAGDRVVLWVLVLGAVAFWGAFAATVDLAIMGSLAG